MTNSTAYRKYIFASIFALSNRLQKLGDRVNDSMTMKQWMLISAISQSDGKMLTIGETASMIGTSHQNVKKMALILQQQGFLSLTKHPTDGRAVLLSLTDRGADYFTRRSDTEQAFLRDVFQSFDRETITGLCNGLWLLGQNIELLERSGNHRVDEDDAVG